MLVKVYVEFTVGWKCSEEIYRFVLLTHFTSLQ